MPPTDATARADTETDPKPAAQPAAAQKQRAAQTITKAAQPTKIFFDPYNSSATGHQTAPSRLAGTASWRDSRSLKLAQQFRGGHAGGEKRLYDTVGAGSEKFGEDGRKENGGWEKGASGLRGKGQLSIVEALGARTVKAGVVSGREKEGSRTRPASETERSQPQVQVQSGEDVVVRPQIFSGLCMYINGSTAPLISDHKLKRLIAEHGGRLSIALGRRTVTHVLLGSGCGRGGAGGGLSSSKIQKEISRVGGKGVKFVGPEWVVESVNAGKRLPEARYTNLSLSAKGQGSVYGLSKAARSTTSDPLDTG